MTAPKVDAIAIAIAIAPAPAPAPAPVIGFLTTTARRTAPIIGIPFDLKPCPIEELSPEMIAAAKAAEREAHPLQVLRLPPVSPEVTAHFREALAELDRLGNPMVMPTGYTVEYLAPADYGPLVASPAFARGKRELRARERTLLPGKKRPGQWGWRARRRRTKRLALAGLRRQRSELLAFPPMNRAARRLLGVFAPIVGVR